ncbi:hypothetical protein QVD17_09453 [Tagetes erecta]|uniref:Uncharacterized protein n=1 Tax=Tagetes erecta TaxID=13708 RepID=A0AAD8P5B6_TARER|nr:hypothetical protein QVD17_09453 [Tagetes erecta]
MKSMKLYLITLISLTSATTSLALYAKPGCNDTCGNILIPYPFGMGTSCYLNEWFSVDCNSSTPYLPAFGYLQLLSLDLEKQTVNVNVAMISDCQTLVWSSSQILSFDLRGSPFLFSQEHNIFVVEGCGNAVIMEQNNNLLTGCSTICRNLTTSNSNMSCYGINCCQTSIPYFLEMFMVNISELQGAADGSCGSAFLVDEGWYYANRFSGLSEVVVPISLRWTLTEQDISGSNCSDVAVRWLDLGNGSEVKTFMCSCSPVEQGSPYLVNGCQVVKECAGCNGECYFNASTGFICFSSQFPLARDKSSTLGVVLGVSISIGLLILSASEKPISLTRSGEHRSLATHFMLAMEEGELISVIDYRIVNDGARGELIAIANLAMQCLNLNGKNRPTMKEVASELERIRMTHVPTNIGNSKYNVGEDEPIML